MKIQKTLAALFAIISSFLLACAAGTSDVEVRSWYDLPALHGGQANITLDGSQRTVAAGQLEATVLQTNERWVTYCTDLGITLASGPFVQLTLPSAQLLPAWQTPDWAPGGAERASTVYFTFRDQVSSDKDAVALQALIWDALYDETASLNSGRFQFDAQGSTGGAYGRAASWLNSPGRAALTGLESWWGPATSSGDYRAGQGLLGNVIAVPEPTVSALLLASVPAVAWGILRRKHN